MKAIIFDFNGTLFRDTRFHIRAWHDFWLDRFGRAFSEQEIEERFIGPGNADILRSCLGPQLTTEDIDRYSEQKEQYYRSAVLSREENRRLTPGAPELLDLLTARGVPFSLATASRITNIRFYLQELGVDRWFDMDRIVYEDGVIPPKPDPAFYTAAAHAIGMEPEDCVVFEDSPTGIRAALNAGIGRIVALEGTGARARLEAFGEAVYAIIPDLYGAERFLND